MDGTNGDPTPELPVWRRFVPAVLAVALVAWIVRDLELADFEASLERVHVPIYVGALIALASTSLVVDVATALPIYRHIIGTLRFNDLLAARATAFLPGLINFHVGQVWLTWILVRHAGADAHRAAAATLVINMVTLGALVLATGLAILAAPAPAPDWLSALVIGGIATVAGYLVVLTARPRALRDRRLLAPLFELGVVGHLRALALRIPHVTVAFAIVCIPLRCFGVAVPLVDALRTVPAIVVLAALPITPAGVGTRDAVAVTLLASFAAGSPGEQRATIVACTLLTGVGLAVLQAVASVVFMSRARSPSLSRRES